MSSKNWLAAAALLALWSCGKKPAEAPQPAAVEAPAAAAAFDEAVKALTRAYFDAMPEMATYVGAPADLASGAAARLSDRTPAGDAARRARLQAEHDRLAAVAPAGLDRTRALQRETILTLLGAALAPAKLVPYGSFLGEYGVWFTPYALWQNGGVAVSIPGILEAQQQIASAADAEAYLERLSAYAKMIDGATAKLMADADEGVVPPDFVIDKTRAVFTAFAAAAPAGNVLASSFAKKLDEAGLADAAAFASRASAIVGNEIYPASARAIAALDALRPKAAHDAGVWRLAQGEALYAALIRQMTDTDLTAEEIHQIGLREVDRILGEMDAILKAQGYREGPVGERMRKLSVEPRFFYPNTEEGKARILKDVAAQLAAVDALAPKWFRTLPNYAVEVRAVPAFSEASAPGGYYDSPALDGSRPGIYWINLRDTAIWPKYAVPTLTYHEAVPGHHFQTAISLGQYQPLILSVLYSNAFGEGWALYSEALAAEMGLYDGDPFGNLGRLQDELHRAIRLVVDTGMHAKRWSREQAIEYMAATEGAHPLEVESEIERFAVWPGQALGYKMGMLKIQALRKEAETALGTKFDIRAFHDLVLKDGAVPLPVLERSVREWIAAEKS
ncbi:MAG: DUF885 domain-containing protein [Parvularculaceae bacterium]